MSDSPGTSKPTYFRLVVDKARLLADLDQLHRLLREYQQFIAQVPAESDWEQDALNLLRSHQAALARAQVSFKTIELVSALLEHTLPNLKASRFTFRVELPPVPSDPAVAEPPGDPDNAELAATIEHVLAQINALASTAPLALQEKLRYLLVSCLKLFRAMIDRDVESSEDAISQINLLTANRESQRLLREVAIIARGIFDSLNTLSDGLPLQQLTASSTGVTDALGKLNSVLEKLEQAATQNLDGLEILGAEVRADAALCTATLEGLGQAQRRLGELKARHPELAPRLAALQALLGDRIGAEMMSLQQSAQRNQEVFLALIANQSFQDLTGQALRKIIVFVESLQLKLVQMLQVYRPVFELIKGADLPAEPEPEPPGAEASTPRQTQDQVDELLANLGF
ncbi:MAG: protein phosphatase CheZ [Candidatus Lambdaproteobacteria bacterium]|nr:protein phosphatase CheZ [Candidatus Lambdaproteobacteria bacterium]